MAPSKQDMKASITLDKGSEGPFTPGSRLSGRATLQSLAPNPIRSADVIFFGHAITHGAKMGGVNGFVVSLDFADDSNLFCIQQPMVQDGADSWSFNLQFPEHTGVPQGISPYAQETRYTGSFVDKAHVLPPSFSMIAGAATYAMIEYNAQAVFEIDGQKDVVTDQLAEPLLLLARAQGPPPQQSPVEFIKLPEKYASSRLQGGASSKRQSFTERSSFSAPSVDVVIKAKAPTVLNTGRAFMINVAVELDNPSTPNISVPSINIRFKDLQLRKITFIRCLRPTSEEAGGGHRAMELKSEETIMLNSLPESVNAMQQLSTSGDRKIWLYPATFEVRVPGSTCPGFSTFNINHQFRIMMTVEADIAGKKFEYDIYVPDVLILPPS